MSDWEIVLGLEVHCQLRTATKLFCACANAFGAPPNTLTCPVCTGQPGALPVLNREALALAVRAALALEGEIDCRSEFDRKNYFYCDLPKGYQISQYDLPLCFDGAVDMPLPEKADKDSVPTKRVGIIRAHLEEDAGKLSNELPGGAPSPDALVDFNRAGTPLLEIVTHPDFRTAYDANKAKEPPNFAGAPEEDA